MSDPTDQGAQRLEHVTPHSPPPSASAVSSSSLTTRPKKGAPGMGIPLRRAIALVTMVEVASTVVKTRDASEAPSALQGSGESPRKSVTVRAGLKTEGGMQ
jgi:hypothetical protein